MIEYETEQEKEVLVKLCDLALKANGLAVKGGVDFILNSLRKKEVKPEEEKQEQEEVKQEE